MLFADYKWLVLILKQQGLETALLGAFVGKIS